MNVKAVKTASKRVEQNYSQKFNIQTYGEDNNYPQSIANLINSSPTGSGCLKRFAEFIEGYGFSNEIVSNLEINHLKETMDDLLRYITADLAKFGGFSIHVNYNIFGKITELQSIPFETCRLAEKDDAGNVAYIKIHPDWAGKTTKRGKIVRLDEKNIKSIHVFNPIPEVVQAQIQEAGSIQEYQGQILWASTAGKWQYPTPVYDSAITEISTDEGLSNLKYRNVRNNFHIPCMLIAKKGVPKYDENTDHYGETEQMISDEDLKQFQGDTNTGKIMYIELESDEDRPEVVPFPTKSFDKDFDITDQSVKETIYATFQQELFYAIRIGKLGFSGDVMRDAYEYYAGKVTGEQRFIIRHLMQLLDKWVEPINAPDLSIMPMRWVSSSTTNTI